MSNIKLITPISRRDLLRVAVPKGTASYSPVPHKKVIELTLEQLDKAGLKVLSEAYHMARNGNQARGSYEIGIKDKEMHLKLAWHNSYDKTMPVRWAMGAHIIVCENGMVVGDLGIFKRRHTGTVLEDYAETIKEHILQAGSMFDTLKNEREQMKNIDIDSRTRAELIGRMFLEDKILTSTQLGIIRDEIENPSYGDYGAPGTIWELYNHGTVGMKQDHPTSYIDHHIKYHNFFRKEFKLETV
jgi:hypothetical protein